MSALEVVAGAAVLAGAVLQSAVGFGFALVCAPLVFAAFGPEPAVGLLTALAIEVNLVTLLGERRRPVPLRRLVAILLACAVPGMVAGVAVLRNVDAVVLQVAVTVVVLASLALRRIQGTGPRSPAWTPVVGVSAGVLTTTTGTAGPPVVLLLLGRGLSPERVRDTLTVSFLGLALLGGAVLALTGTRRAAPEAVVLAALMPLAAVGQVAGRPLFARLAGGHYEPVLTGVLVASAVVGLATAAI